MDSHEEEALIYTRTLNWGVNDNRPHYTEQEERCRRLAARRGYEVVASFDDHGCNDMAERRGFRAIIALLQDASERPPVVIVDYESPFMRDPHTRCEIEAAIEAAGSCIDYVTTLELMA